MLTQILTADASAIARAAALLCGGGLVAFPTETVYGLGANALDERAVAGIFVAKGRPSNNPLIVHIANVNDAIKLAATWPTTAQQLAERFWPGPLTLVVPASPRIPAIVTAGGPTVALRLPAHPVAQALLRETGLPLAAPSANVSSSLSPTCAAHVLASLGGRIPLILDGGVTQGGLESTVLDVSASPPVLLRPGLVSPAQIEAVIGTINRAAPVGTLLKSPGLMNRHYAPRTPLECTADGGDHVLRLIAKGLRVGWLSLGWPSEHIAALDSATCAMFAMPRDAASYMAQLYWVLHLMDSERLDRIVVSLPPVGDEWLAVHDRLKRAAAVA